MITYSVDFVLSLKNLDICQNLPNSFNNLKLIDKTTKQRGKIENINDKDSKTAKIRSILNKISKKNFYKFDTELIDLISNCNYIDEIADEFINCSISSFTYVISSSKDINKNLGGDLSTMYIKLWNNINKKNRSVILTLISYLKNKIEYILNNYNDLDEFNRKEAIKCFKLISSLYNTGIITFVFINSVLSKLLDLKLYELICCILTISGYKYNKNIDMKTYFNKLSNATTTTIDSRIKFLIINLTELYNNKWNGSSTTTQTNPRIKKYNNILKSTSLPYLDLSNIDNSMKSIIDEYIYSTNKDDIIYYFNTKNKYSNYIDIKLKFIKILIDKTIDIYNKETIENLHLNLIKLLLNENLIEIIHINNYIKELTDIRDELILDFPLIDKKLDTLKTIIL